MRRNLFLTTLVWLMLPGIAYADAILIDFESGRPPASIVQITELTPTTVLAFSEGRMNITMPNQGDGVFISPNAIRNPVCWILDGLSLNSFMSDTGLGFDLVFGDESEGNRFETEWFNSDIGTFNSDTSTSGTGPGVTFFARTVVNGVPGFAQRITVPCKEIPDLNKIRIDWVRTGPMSEGFVIEGRCRDGTEIPRKVIPSTLQHETFFFTGSRIRNARLTPFSTFSVNSPSVSVDSLEVSDVHVPEPATVILLGTGLAGLAIKTRERLKSRKTRQGRP